MQRIAISGCTCRVGCYNSFFVFLFKQKTAYEMRISDWSSDVCSSDLRVLGLVIASELFRRFPKAAEGELSSRLHALASGETCARIARNLDLSAHVRFGAQAIGDGGRQSDNIAADEIGRAHV